MLTIGVDAHKRVHAAVAVDAVGREVGHWRGPNAPAAWQALATWAAALDGARCWGIEGAWQYGRGLAQTLVAAGDAVVEVNPRLTAAERRGSRSADKSDRLDARAVARVTLREAATLPAIPPVDGTSVAAVWTQERAQLEAEATALRNQAHQVLAQLLPDYQTTRPELVHLTSAAAVAALAAFRVDPAAGVLAQARAGQLQRLGVRLEQVMAQLAQVTAALSALGARWGGPLVAITGVGALTAGELLGHLGPGKRFDTDAQLARHSGTAPLEASSGEATRHRLNRTGNRQLNALFERIARTQARCDQRAIAYLARKRAEGKTTREARRAHKRYICRAVWRAWQQCPIPTLADPAPLVATMVDDG